MPSSCPLNNPIFIKRIALFSCTSPQQAFGLVQGVNRPFQETMVFYGGFVEALINIAAKITNLGQRSLDGKRLASEFAANVLRNTRVARWIVLELSRAGGSEAQSWLPPELRADRFELAKYIIVGDDDEDVLGCLAALFPAISDDRDANSESRTAAVERAALRRLLVETTYDFRDVRHLANLRSPTHIINFLCITGQRRILRRLYLPAKASLPPIHVLTDPDGKQPLDYAIMHGHKQLISVLLSLDPRLSLSADENTLQLRKTCLMQAAQYYFSRGSSGLGEVFELILSRLQQQLKKQRNVIGSGDCDDTSTTKEQFTRTEIEAQDVNGWRVLHYAVNSNAIEAVLNLVVELGADVNARTNDGKTPLSIAATRGFEEIAEFLIFARARLHDKGAANNPDAGSRPTLSTSFVGVAVWNGHAKLLKNLFRHRNVWQIAAPVNRQTRVSVTQPIHLAVKRNNFELVKFLICGCLADVNAEDELGNTPLHLAARNVNAKMLSLLMANGANTFALKCLHAKQLRTPLETARTANIALSSAHDTAATSYAARAQVESGLRAAAVDALLRGADEYAISRVPRIRLLRRDICRILFNLIPNVRPARPPPLSKKATPGNDQQRTPSTGTSSSSLKDFGTVQEQKSFVKAMLMKHNADYFSRFPPRKRMTCTVTAPPDGGVDVPVEKLLQYHQREAARLASAVRAIEHIESHRRVVIRSMTEVLEAFDEIDRKLEQLRGAILSKMCFTCVGCGEIADDFDSLLVHCQTACPRREEMLNAGKSKCCVQ